MLDIESFIIRQTKENEEYKNIYFSNNSNTYFTDCKIPTLDTVIEYGSNITYMKQAIKDKDVIKYTKCLDILLEDLEFAFTYAYHDYGIVVTKDILIQKNKISTILETEYYQYEYREINSRDDRNKPMKRLINALPLIFEQKIVEMLCEKYFYFFLNYDQFPLPNDRKVRRVIIYDGFFFDGRDEYFEKKNIFNNNIYAFYTAKTLFNVYPNGLILKNYLLCIIIGMKLSYYNFLFSKKNILFLNGGWSYYYCLYKSCIQFENQLHRHTCSKRFFVNFFKKFFIFHCTNSFDLDFIFYYKYDVDIINFEKQRKLCSFFFNVIDMYNAKSLFFDNYYLNYGNIQYI